MAIISSKLSRQNKSKHVCVRQVDMERLHATLFLYLFDILLRLTVEYTFNIYFTLLFKHLALHHTLLMIAKHNSPIYDECQTQSAKVLVELPPKQANQNNSCDNPQQIRKFQLLWIRINQDKPNLHKGKLT